MSSPFLEERLAVDVLMGASYADQYAVDITVTAGGSESRRLVHPYPVRYWDISYVLKSPADVERVGGLYHRAFGMFGGFRVRAADDYSTNSHTAAPTAFDQPLQVLTAGASYQLQKQYGTTAPALGVGYPVRTIFKPVAGTVLVGIRNTITGDHAQTAGAAWSVDVTTGVVTMAANKTKPVTAITQAASAVLTVGSSHGFIVGDSVHVSGVSGMTQINGRRGTVTATSSTTITVSINSTAFSAYTSGGTVNTRPQTGETVRGGCEFDIPCRFNSRIDYTHVTRQIRTTGPIEIVELINP